MQHAQSDLANIVGHEHLIDAEALGQRNPGYCTSSQNAACLVRPKSIDELSAIAAYAHKAGLTLVPQGGLTGLVDGTAATKDNIIVSMERMNQVLRVDPVQNVLIAQAGTRLQDAHNAAAEHGLMLGVDIPSRGSCTIGGIVSTNAGGIRVIRYGMTRENILGLTVVLADGTVIDADNTLMKNNAGFDLKQLFIGSEGTLGLVAEAVFKLYPKPSSESTALVAAKSLDEILTLLSTCRKRLGGQLLSFEVMWQDHYAAATADPSYGEPPLSTDYPIYGIVESAVFTNQASDTDVAGGNAVSELQSILEDAMNDETIVDGVLAQSEKERAKIWEAREDSEYLKTGFDHLHSYDVGFELQDIGPFVDALRVDMEKDWPGKPVYVFGHLGDGNLHIVLTLSKQEHEESSRFDDVIYGVVSRFKNSTVSAEHGIGMLKRPYLSQSRSDPQIALMKTLKTALDPSGVLNPGKIFIDNP